MSSATRTPTGINGLDAMLGGGIPQGRIILIIAGPGAGKTTLVSHFLHEGARKHGENSVYISLEESKHHYYSEMKAFNWDFESLEKEKKFGFVDASPIRTLPGITIGPVKVGKRDFSLASLLGIAMDRIKEFAAKRLVLDSVSSLTIMYTDPAERRNAILDLFEALSNTGATCLITTEITSYGSERPIQLEEYLAHGVIMMKSVTVGGVVTRSVQIVKMRQTKHDHQPRPYEITDNGIEVRNEEQIFE